MLREFSASACKYLYRPGRGTIYKGLGDALGVTPSSDLALRIVAADTLCATYNDLDSVRALFKANKGQIAGIILEPVVGNSGFIVPTQEFLEVWPLLSPQNPESR